jgi:hypothetical protein
VFVRTGGVESVTQSCWAAGHQFLCYIGGAANTLVGIGEIDGKIENASGRRATAWIQNGRRYTSVVKVRKDGVQVYLDGKLITELKTDYSNLAVNGEWQSRRGDTIGVGSWASPTIFYSVEVTEITGKGQQLK